MNAMNAVVGWDGSAPSGAALRWAADREKWHGGAVRLLQVLDPGSSADPAAMVGSALVALGQAAAEVGRRSAGVGLTASIAVGDPAEELCKAAGRHDLLVIGASKRGRMIDSGARSVPICIAGRGEGLTAIVPAEPPSGRSGVIAAVYGRGRSLGTAFFAASEAAARGEPLTLLRIVDPVAPVPHDICSLRPEVEAVTRRFPNLTVHADSAWVRGARSLLERADGAALFVLEGHHESTAQPRLNLERELAANARTPCVVVSEPATESDAPVGDLAVNGVLTLLAG